ncbi:tyrosine-protein kinase receptor Tie-1 [Hemiscyllium ocellatum]|uniref:tyrosine-protein kinase receptor Tie-1 n=1 Tax=Hemiscyllium ocellatum TaxID=170820 RepID=UPI002965FAD0|nr:tyrosine-protein kinase receptor Tie-1 [Hemiscyllium ocellatum]XP_060686546.1 tyrosine-protein kinase receptor Tie-1 [Hemiscyllium ocellatum]
MFVCRLYSLTFAFHLTGAILDLYLITDLNSSNVFPLSCVSGERRSDGPELRMEKDSSIVQVKKHNFNYETDSSRHNGIQATGSSKDWEQVGIYYCEGRRQAEKTHIVTIINSNAAEFYPSKLTTTVNKGETALLVVQKLNAVNEDVMWKCNGTYFSTIHVNEIENGTVSLKIDNATPSHTCVYSTSALSGNFLNGVFFRLIVRACPHKKWGTACDKDCPDCLNGGICHEGTGECICGPGFSGENCEMVCEKGKFGRNCQEDCKRQKSCSGYRFCLPDPYGCSCAAGWRGRKCSEECSPNTYGPECRLKCQCQNGASCDRFHGCKCPVGWHGQYCEKSDHIPKIVDTFTEVELNLNSSPVMKCSASAKPLPSNKEIQIRKPNGAILKATKSIMQGNLTTSEFKLPQISLLDAGVWECRVSTSTGTDSRRFKIIVKEPPVPISIPRLLEKKSKQLKVDPNSVNFTGDGPVKSVKLLYKPNDSGAQWSSIVVDNNEPITLMNLKPSTSYLVRVQLTRPGEGGEGPPGPDAILETDCPEPTMVAKIDRALAEGRDTISVSWNVSKDHEPGTGFVVRVTGSGNSIKKEVRVQPLSVRSTQITNLQPGQAYKVDVMVYHCDSLGPPSESVMVEVDAGPPPPRNLQAIPLSLTSIQLKWLPPLSTKEINKYTIEYQQVESLSKPTWIDTTGNKTLNDLSPSTQYQFRVRAQSNVAGEWSIPVTSWTFSNSIPPAPYDIKISNVTDTSAVISWVLPKKHAISSVVIRCKVYGATTYTEDISINLAEMPTSEYVLKELQPETPYLVEVLAKNNKGESKPNVMKELRTAATPPATSGIVQTPKPLEPLTGGDQQLLMAIVGSVSVTCLTILLALLGLFCVRKTLFQRRRTFTYQSGSGEETVLQFNSGTLTLTRRPKPQPEPLTYPILEWDDIKFEDVIGEGNFGQVIKALVKKDGLKMNAAIKMLKEFASENDHRDFAGELEVLCKLGHHPNIINLLGACENRGYLYIAIEYAPYGNLLDFLRKSRVLETDPAFAREHGTASTLTSQQLLQFASDVTKGMQYLSEKQFIHRDLAARNVLVGENLVAKIADFGLSRGEEVYVKKTMGRLPVRWMAIESLNYSVYTTKSDVWSFGVLLWEIVSLGGTPYCGMTCAELYEKLPQGFRMEKPLNCDDEVYEFMRQCWRDRPYERPTFAQISVQLNRMLEARKAYVNTALFENFTYAGIDATAEEV